EDYQRLPTPSPANPKNAMQVIQELSQKFSGFDAIAAGFPGYVKDGVVKTAPNLDNAAWASYNLQKELADALGKPALVVNDADMQGLAIASGKGLELVVTLGTGFGTAFLKDGILIPHLEIAHHPVTKKKDYDAYIGEAELKRIGVERWNRRIKRVIGILKVVFNYDRLYISGGCAKQINFEPEDNIIITGNKDGIKGGAKLWQVEYELVVYRHEMLMRMESNN
ncbi:MAG TPA: ROK family protein, partial [Chitinophagaceae bacterium]|nr:ROK family protein [Chitinophagaceae bacterium]